MTTSWWDRVARGFSFIKQALIMWTQDKSLLLPSVLALAANFVLLAVLVATLVVTGLLAAFAGEGEEAVTAALLVVSAGYGVVAWLVTFFFGGMTIHMVDVHLQGRKGRLADAFADAFHNLGAIAVLAGASVLVELITGMLKNRRGLGGMIGRLAGEAVEWVWRVVTCLALPIIIVEDTTFSNALRRAKEIHSRNLLGVGIGEVGVGIVGALITFAAMLAGGAVTLVGFSVSSTAGFVGVGVLLALLSAAIAFNSYVRWSYYTMLYLWAAEREQAGLQAPAPAPLQMALGYVPATVYPGPPQARPPFTGRW